MSNIKLFDAKKTKAMNKYRQNRRVGRNQRGNQNPQIEERQTTQSPKQKE